MQGRYYTVHVSDARRQNRCPALKPLRMKTRFSGRASITSAGIIVVSTADNIGARVQGGRRGEFARARQTRGITLRVLIELIVEQASNEGWTALNGRTYDRYYLSRNAVVLYWWCFHFTPPPPPHPSRGKKKAKNIHYRKKKKTGREVCSLIHSSGSGSTMCRMFVWLDVL